MSLMVYFHFHFEHFIESDLYMSLIIFYFHFHFGQKCWRGEKFFPYSCTMRENYIFQCWMVQSRSNGTYNVEKTSRFLLTFKVIDIKLRSNNQTCSCLGTFLPLIFLSVFSSTQLLMFFKNLF